MKYGGLFAGLVLATIGLTSPAFAITTVDYTSTFHFSDIYGDYLDLSITTTGQPGPLPSDGAGVTNIIGNGNVGILGGAVVVTGPGSFGGADNELYSDAPFVDSSGIAFDIAATIDPPYLWNANGIYDCTNGCSLLLSADQFTVASTTPLPAALPMFGAAAAAGAGLLGWRKRKKKTA
jgi:LPXTG-motif cell wall-anchored protein